MSDFSNTDSSTNLVFLSDDSTPVTSTEVIASETQVEHSSVIKTVRSYRTDFEEFGLLDFKSRSSGGRPTEFALLNEQQATLLVTYMRNSDVVRDFKKRLVKAFYEFANRVKSDLPQDYLAALKALVVTEEAKQRLEAQNRALNQQIETEKPYAELARAITGKTAITRRDWAKLMKTDHGLRVGERAVNQWLFDKGYLFKDARTGTTRAYAKYEDQGLFEQDAEVINGKPRFIIKITGEGIKKLTPKVLAHFAEKVYVFEDFI